MERPPEPTVPDERVDTTSEEEEEDSHDQHEQNQDFHPKSHSGPGNAVRKDTTAAISDLLYIASALGCFQKRNIMFL